MLELIGVGALVVGSLQFGLQLTTYLKERKKRKRQSEQEVLQHPHHHLYPYFSSPSTSCISYHGHHAYLYNYHGHCCMYPPPTSYLHPPLLQHHALYLPISDPPPPLQHPGGRLYNHGNHGHNCSYSLSNSLHRTPSKSSNVAPLIEYPSNLASADWLGLLDGHMELLPHQEAPHNTQEPLGMRTGACAYFDKSSSYSHWKSLQEEGCLGLQQKTIAVVDWSRGNIDMFVEIRGAYFRNYRVCRCDVAVFADLFKERTVFSGEIRGGKLARFSREMKMVENVSGAGSTNSWLRLGIYEEGEEMEEVLREGGSFVEMVRGAVFGLVCCLYETPSHLNVDMESAAAGQHLDIVRVNCHHHHHHHHHHHQQHPPLYCCDLPRRHESCVFSVYCFGDHGWAAQDVLVG